MTAISRSQFTAGATALASVAFVRRAARAADDLRVAVIPEVATTAASYSDKAPLIELLQRATGRRVKLLIPANYAATVEAIGNDTVDFAHFGGLTYLKAHERYGVIPVVQRLEDRRFHSFFITSEKAGLKELKDVRGKNFAFGDVVSTSGHLMPAKALLDAGIDPDRDIKVRYTGNHTATAIAVASGQVDAGAMDESVYKKMVADKTIDESKAKVFFVTKPFVDYVWAARKDLEPELISSLRRAFIGARDRKVLDILRSTYYVTANDKEYDVLRDTARKLSLL